MKSDADIRLLLKAELTRHVTKAELARQAKCSEAYISLVLSGDRTPGPKILKYLGIARETNYRTTR